MRPENFLIIAGAMKCGTSTLFDILAEHPEVAPSREKEPGFFSFPEVYAKGIGWYMDLWSESGKKEGVTVRLEASTHYTKEPDNRSGAHLIGKHLRNVKFVYVVRNPIKRIESQVNYDRMRGRLLGKSNFLDPHTLNVTRYMRQMDPYLELFGKESLLVIDFDELIRDPASVLERICAFSGIDSSFRFSPLPHRNKTNSRHSQYQRLRKWGRYHHKPRWLQALIRVCGVPLELMTLEKERMSEADRTAVCRHLRDDILRFEKTFGWYPLDEAVLASLRGDDAAADGSAPSAGLPAAPVSGCP